MNIIALHLDICSVTLKIYIFEFSFTSQKIKDIKKRSYNKNNFKFKI